MQFNISVSRGSGKIEAPADSRLILAGTIEARWIDEAAQRVAEFSAGNAAKDRPGDTFLCILVRKTL
jgi:hypothetical protein